MSDQVMPFGKVLSAQVRLLLDRRWRGRAIGFAIILAQLVAIVGFGTVLGMAISSDGVRIAHVVDFVEMPRTTTGLLFAFGVLLFISWFGSFRAFEDEVPSKRGYHWAMPVAKKTHDLARVLAGLVLLLGWTVALYAAVATLSIVRPGSGSLLLPAPVWLCLLLGPVLVYLLTSLFVVRLEHATGWILSLGGAGLAIVTFWQVLSSQGHLPSFESLSFGRLGLPYAVAGPVASLIPAFAEAGFSSFSWLASWSAWFLVLGLGVVWLAGDRRRLP